MVVDSPVGLVERRLELGEIDSLLDAMQLGSGRLLVIEGPAGIGKTKLVRLARERALSDGVMVLAGQGGELERHSAWSVARQLLTGVARDGELNKRDRRLTGAAAVAADVLGLDETGTAGPATDPFAAVHGLYWLVANLAAQRPVLVAVDDIHWADPPTLRFLAYLAARVEDHALGLVLATRPFTESGDPDLLHPLTAVPQTRLIQPRPLSGGGAARLVRATLGEDATDELCRACHRVTGGNPFLLRELAVELAAEGIPSEAGRAETVAELVPESVARSVLLRIVRLPAAAGELARAVAVLGRGPSLQRAAALAEQTPDEALDAAEALVGASILGPEPPLDFVHPLLRAAVYMDMSGPARLREHARAARLLLGEGAPVAEIASHLLLAPPAGDPRAFHTLYDAGLEARRRGAPEAAAQYLRRALEEPPPARKLAAALRELGLAEFILRGDAAVRHLEAGVDAAGDKLERAAISLDLGRAMQSLDRPSQAVGAFAGGLDALDDLDTDLARRLEAELVLAAMEDPSLAPEIEGRLMEAAARLGRGGPADALVLSGLSVAAAAAGVPDAVGLARQALKGDHLFDEDASTALGFPVVALAWFDRLDEATETLDRALKSARRRGAAASVPLYSSARAWVALRRGDLREAEADARLAIDLLAERGDDPLAAPVRTLVEALVDQGDLDGAERALAHAGFTGEVTEMWSGTELLWARGRLRLAQRRTEAGLADLFEAGKRLELWTVSNPAACPWRSAAAIALLGLGRRDEASDLAAAEVEAARQVAVPTAVGIALRAAGLVEGGSRGLGWLEEATDLLRSSPALLERARAFVEYGAALRRAGRRDAARTPLREGLDLATGCGAHPLAERARAELRAAGARPRRDALRGRDALTASELRVARMAAEGMTNRQIAEALFVTLKTIETHLSHAYGKLDVSSRRDLPAALEDHPAAAPQSGQPRP